MLHEVLPAIMLTDTATYVWTSQKTVAPQVCMPAMSEDKRKMTLAGTTSMQLNIIPTHCAATSLRVKMAQDKPQDKASTDRHSGTTMADGTQTLVLKTYMFVDAT